MTDIIPAFCVGVTQVSVGHPFDTVKVLMQNNKKWVGLPLKSYYRGWRFPLVSATFFNCTVFPVYEYTIKYTNNSIVSGALSGVMVTPFVYFFDSYKIRKQTLQPVSLSMFKKPYYGFASTFNREVVAMTAYFGSYYYFKDDCKLNPFFAGGLAGLSNWTLTYPLDVIRSRQIAQQIPMRLALAQGHLWKGYSVCAARALIVNAANFWVYEKVKSLINS